MLLKHKKRLLYSLSLVFGLVLTFFALHKDQNKHEVTTGLEVPVANADTPGGNNGGDTGGNNGDTNNNGDTTTTPPPLPRGGMGGGEGHSGDDGDDSSRWSEDM